jgi:uncharacterized protein YbbK (DUF523 family)
MAGSAKILVSACLMGHAVRYDGRAKPLDHPLIARWRDEGLLVTICPELSAGMPVPRPPAEIAAGAGGSGSDVLAGQARVVEADGTDLSEGFRQAAANALALALETGCTHALLIDGSPSCGSRMIYDGGFSGTRRAGEGVTAALLRAHGIRVFADHEIEQLAAELQEISTREAR